MSTDSTLENNLDSARGQYLEVLLGWSLAGQIWRSVERYMFSQARVAICFCYVQLCVLVGNLDRIDVPFSRSSLHSGLYGGASFANNLLHPHATPMPDSEVTVHFET